MAVLINVGHCQSALLVSTTNPSGSRTPAPRRVLF
jgi:hypothetical protein